VLHERRQRHLHHPQDAGRRAGVAHPAAPDLHHHQPAVGDPRHLVEPLLADHPDHGAVGQPRLHGAEQVRRDHLDGEAAERQPRGRYRLLTRARSFGGTLEWWVARELSTRLGFEVATGVRSGARGIGGDLDVVASFEGKLLHLELKSGPPKHLTDAEVGAFLRRVRALRPDLALFVMDTALRLSDKVLPMFEKALRREDGGPFSPRRLVRDTWALTPHLYLVNAKENLIDNVRRAIAEGLRAMAPPAP